MLAAELGVVQSLVEQSLLRRAGDRFWMLETIREFALERLGGLPGREELLAAHAAFALGVAQKAGQRLEGAEAPATARGVDVEHDNLRAAMEWAYASGHAARGVEIAALLER